MTPLLWFLAGACLGALIGVIAMALVAAGARAEDWGDRLATWDGADYDVVFTPNDNWDDYFASKEAELTPGRRISPWLTIRGRR